MPSVESTITNISKHPGIFGGKAPELPPEWENENDFIPVLKPDGYVDGEGPIDSETDRIESEIAGEICNDFGAADGLDDIFFPGISGGGWSGAHMPGGTHGWPPTGVSPSPASGFPSTAGGSTTVVQPSPASDCLAFYLPFHYFGSKWWGIYLIRDGVKRLALRIYRSSGGAGFIDARRAVTAARIFLYHHEHFHHRVECFSVRFELILRKPCYGPIFEVLYRANKNTAHWSEEGLANAEALDKVWEKTGRMHYRMQDALVDFVDRSPPGYNLGTSLTGDRGRRIREEFAEIHQAACNPGTPALPSALWASTPHFLTGISNVTSRVNYIVPSKSRIAMRTPLGHP